MRRVIVGLVACAALLSAPRAQVLDTVCFINDIPVLLESGILLDTGGLLGSIDTVVVNGGTCDSVGMTMYFSYPYVGIPVSVVKMNGCSAHVVITGLGDTIVNVCPASVLPRVVTGSAARSGGAVLRLEARNGSAEVLDKVQVYNLDGTLVRGPGRNVAHSGATGIRVLVHRRPRE